MNVNDSNLNAIWVEAVAVIHGLGLTLNNTVVPVVQRKLSKKDEFDTLPLITVWAGRDADTVKWISFNGWVNTTYTLEIAVVSANDGDELSNIDTYTIWRQQIRQQFQGPAFDNIQLIFDKKNQISKILDVDSGRDNFLTDEMISDLYDYQTVGVVVQVIEPSSY